VKGFEESKDLEEDSIIFDKHFRTLKTRYVDHKIVTRGKSKVYKLFLKVQMAEHQIPIA